MNLLTWILLGAVVVLVVALVVIVIAMNQIVGVFLGWLPKVRK
jgi:hypothetical protein